MRRTFLALALTAALLAGCDGDDEEPAATATAAATEEPAGGGGGGETIDVSAPADGSLKFDQSELSAKAGKVTIKFANPSQVPHAVEIEGNGVETETETVTDGDASVSTDLKPGTYTFYCPVGQHREAGMEGTLTVK
jgi:plastocyanin